MIIIDAAAAAAAADDDDDDECVLVWSGTGWIYPYPPGSVHRHWNNHMIAPMPVNHPELYE